MRIWILKSGFKGLINAELAALSCIQTSSNILAPKPVLQPSSLPNPLVFCGKEEPINLFRIFIIIANSKAYFKKYNAPP